jgi:hypothetical protein
VRCVLSLAAVGSAESDDAPSSRSSYLSAASGKARRGTPGEANAADIVLAVINSTRQRASKLSNRSRQVRDRLGGTASTGGGLAAVCELALRRRWLAGCW